jgi:hypothetical protein
VRACPKKLYRKSLHVDVVSLFKRLLTLLVLLGVAVLTERYAPLVAWLDAHATISSDPDMSDLDCLS